MKAKDFIKVLRTVIREEVRLAVRQELKEVLNENKKPAINLPSKQTSNQQIKKYTNNPILDQVLNETKLTPDFRQSSNVGYDDIGSFTTNNISSNNSSIMDIEPTDDYESSLPEMSSTLPFMKDYSQLMKKADQIASQKQF